MRQPRPLTQRQINILGFVCLYYQENGVPPTIREIGVEFGILSTNAVADTLHSIEVKGYITREGGGKARGIRPTAKCSELGLRAPRVVMLESLYSAVREWYLRPATSIQPMREAVEALMAHDKKEHAA